MSILMVENNPNDEKLAVMAFKQTHPSLDVKVLRNGVDAIDYLLGEQPSTQPDLIMLDLKMPRIGGLEVLRRIRHDNRTSLIPVVIFSSSTEPEDMTQAYKLGANSYITKPMDFDAFLYMVEHLKVYWLEINQLPKISASRR
jgi:two-component system, response regulator